MVSPAEYSPIVYCEHCHAANSTESSDCRKCGFPLPLNETLPPAESERSASEETSSQTNAARPWYRIWTMAATEPSVETYKQIIADPGLTGMKAILWIACPFLLDAVIAAVLLAMLAQGLNRDAMNAVLQQVSGAGRAPFEAAVVLGVIHFVAQLLGGQGKFRNLYCAFAALFAPIGVCGRIVSTGLVILAVSNATAASPGILILLISWALIAYIGFLTLVAIRAVYEFSWGRSVMAALASIPLLFGYLLIASMAYD